MVNMMLLLRLSITLALLVLCLPAAAADKPNIILVMADDQGWGDAGFRGHKRLKTPELDKMAAAGVQMPNFFSASPVCSPSRATCLTGRHHDRSAVPGHSKAINPDETTIADALAANGYRTGLFGKWHLSGCRGEKMDLKKEAPFLPDKLGFQYWFATGNNADKVNPTHYFLNGEHQDKQKGEDSKVIMDHALSWIDQAAKAKQPFYACIWFHTPHTPYGSTPEYLDMYKDVADEKQREYYAQLTAMDAQVGRLRAELRRLGIADNTLLVFTSDNGPKIDYGSTGPYPGKKGRLSEGGNRVPCLIEWPAVVKKPFVSEAAMVSTDFYPTFLAAAGIKSFGPERTLDGENMLPVLTGDGTHRRTEPIRFLFGKTKKAKASVSPDGKWGKANDDPGYAAWEASVTADAAVSWARVKELRESLD